jgi:flagellin
MRIQHNIMAMNSYRNYNNNTKALSANLEKLSSGYRINRAGDDAAGLAISEKMRAQITGLDAAKKNAKDANGLIKTAEGALQEVQDMLNRMVYLAEQSANGTYDNDIDRKALQDEVDSLASEINRIGQTANFNGKKLLDGSMGSEPMKFQIGDSAAAADQLDMSVALGDLKTFDLTGFIETDSVTAAGPTNGNGTPANINVLDPEKALEAVDKLRGTPGGGPAGVEPADGLINKISAFRGKLGAVSNRLDHTVNNLSVMQENIQDAESTIRDTDVADEMMKYTKNNILIQSAQAMLAQSNAVPQGVLQLLQ